MGEYDDLHYDPPTPRKQVALEGEIKRLRAEIAKLREALNKTRAAIIQSAADTLWVGDIETAVDCIDAALNGDTK